MNTGRHVSTVRLNGITWLYLLVATGVTTPVGPSALTEAMQTETARRAIRYSYLQVGIAQ